jgi:hypothetical protein
MEPSFALPWETPLAAPGRRSGGHDFVWQQFPGKLDFFEKDKRFLLCPLPFLLYLQLCQEKKLSPAGITQENPVRERGAFHVSAFIHKRSQARAAGHQPVRSFLYPVLKKEQRS